MKKILSVSVIGLAGSLSLGVFDAAAHLEVSAGVQITAAADFYAPLEPYGAWVEVGSYGRCWRPARVAVAWRPYCEGTWVWTDCGWYWDSDEPWGWACYHYGGWVCDSSFGWVWVPGLEWAPAWVSWRVGGGFVGWAPLGPGGVFLRTSVAVGSPFVFVEAGHFDRRVGPSTVIVNNTTIINKTTQITNLKRETRTFGGSGAQKVMVNEGPGVAVVQKATGRTFQPASIRQVAARAAAPSSLAHPRSEPAARSKPAASPAQSRPDWQPPKEPGRPEHGQLVPTTPSSPHEAPRGGPWRGSYEHGGGHGHGKPGSD